MKYVSESLLLLAFTLVVACGIYPLCLWCIGQSIFAYKANGSLIELPTKQIIGSRLIAQQFTDPEYFHPRPSAANYDAAFSASSALAPSNYFLRSRIANDIAQTVKFSDGALIGPAIDAWFQANRFDGQVGIVALWARMNDSLAKAWVESSQERMQYVEDWVQKHPSMLQEFAQTHPALTPRVSDLAVAFFESFAINFPGKFPNINGAPINSGPEIQGIFFDMWRHDNRGANLQLLPADMVTTSASGLDPHITVANARHQLDRVASARAAKLQRNSNEIRSEIRQMIEDGAIAPFGGLAGDRLLNVLELNAALHQRYGT